jgi:hypothetical protein
MEVGGRPLELASCGVREILWVSVYDAGLYLRPGAAPDAAADATEPVALAVRVESAVHFPYRMPAKWHQALASGLDAQSMERVQNAYRSLRDGDVLTVRYDPGKGVALAVNGNPVASGDHRLIAALLQAWADDRPVAEKIRRIVLDHPCDP